MNIFIALIGCFALLLAFTFQYYIVRGLERARARRELAAFAAEDPVGYELWLARARVEMGEQAISELTRVA